MAIQAYGEIMGEQAFEEIRKAREELTDPNCEIEITTGRIARMIDFLQEERSDGVTRLEELLKFLEGGDFSIW